MVGGDPEELDALVAAALAEATECYRDALREKAEAFFADDAARLDRLLADRGQGARLGELWGGGGPGGAAE